jgi:hypothetical protein
VEVPLPWERLIWGGRSSFAPRVRYFLTDLRLVCVEGDRLAELLLEDVADVGHSQSLFERLTGISTLTVRSANRRQTLVLRGIRRGAQLGALIELLAGDRQASIDEEGVRAVLAWKPRLADRSGREAAAALAVIMTAAGLVMGLHGTAAPETYSPDDPIAPGGVKRSRAEIVRFMQAEVMPWAQAALGPVTGGPERVRCATCHGQAAESGGWQMPAVAALPQPDVRNRGWERYSSAMDAQMRNAIYGYTAQSEKQTRAAYMRQVVMPGMARLLARPPYDFTKPYDYNRSRHAFGCYHCHRVR